MQSKHRIIKDFNKISGLFASFILVAILVFFTIYPFKLDLTDDARYSIAPVSRKLMQEIREPISATLYLNGNLNPAFYQLRRETLTMLSELSRHTPYAINIQQVNPAEASGMTEQQLRFTALMERGIIPSEVFVRDKEGRSIRHTLFPWLEITYKGRSELVSLLKNLPHQSGEENILSSIETLEYEITAAIRRITTDHAPKIAFLEGNGELTEDATYQISKALSQYFQVDRGMLGFDANILNEYKVVIIAGPTQPFTELQKYILDQYLMHGGALLWLAEGVFYDQNMLASEGSSPFIAQDLQIEDFMFRSGVRINPVLVKDRQSLMMPVNVAPAGERPQFDLFPWHYTPLLLSSQQHPITRYLGEVKAAFASSLSIVGNDPRIRHQVLLASSTASKTMNSPGIIQLSDLNSAEDQNFNESFIPVAILAEGNFSSLFTNRIAPPQVIATRPYRSESKHTRQLWIADADIIRNESTGIPSDSTTLPLGFDRVMNRKFSNEAFLVNAINYLAGNEEWMQLRSKEYRMRLLNVQAGKQGKGWLQWIVVGMPLLLMMLFGVVRHYRRKKKFTHN